jgi:hypothetical protein
VSSQAAFFDWRVVAIITRVRGSPTRVVTLGDLFVLPRVSPLTPQMQSTETLPARLEDVVRSTAGELRGGRGVDREPANPREAYAALTAPSLDEFTGRFSHAIDRVSDLTIRAGVDELEVLRQRWLARDAARAGHHGTRWEYHDLRERLLISLGAVSANRMGS